MKAFSRFFSLFIKFARVFTILKSQGIGAFLQVIVDKLGLTRDWNRSVFLRDRFDGWEAEFDGSDLFQVSVVIPVLNGGQGLRSLISSLRLQKGVRKEIILVDSGSDDGSLDGYANDPILEVVPIQKGSFDHSSARNIGVSRARFQTVLLTVQDAEIPDDFWLLRLCHMQSLLGTVALSVAESPKSMEDFYAAFAVYSYNRSIFKERRVTLLSNRLRGTRLDKRASAAIGNVACLYRLEILKQFSFQGSFGEDFSLGLRLLEAGLPIGKTSELVIWHSHNRPAFYWLKRNFASRRLLVYHELDDHMAWNGEGADTLLSILSGFLVVVGEYAQRKMPLEDGRFSKGTDHLYTGREVIASLDPGLSEFIVSAGGPLPENSAVSREFSGLEKDLSNFWSSSVPRGNNRDLELDMFVKAASARLGWILGGVNFPANKHNVRLELLLGSLSHGV